MALQLQDGTDLQLQDGSTFDLQSGASPIVVTPLQPQSQNPRTIRQLYHWAWRQFNSMSVWTGSIFDIVADALATHVNDLDNPHQVLHDQLTDVTPDQHHMRVEWLKPYVGGDPAIVGDMVEDEGWLMIANKDTTEPAAPQVVGTPFYIYAGTMAEQAQLASQIVFGNRYTNTDNGYIEGYRVYVVAGNHYTVYSVIDPLGSATINTLVDFTADTTGWREYSVTPIFINPGFVLDIVATVNEPDPTPVIQTYSYDYQTPQNIAVPAAGQIIHSRGQADTMSINYLDNGGGDRTAFLQSLDVGDIIDGAGARWSIQNIVPDTGFIRFGVNPALVGAPIGVQDFDFETVEPTPITTAFDTDYWLTSGYSAQGLEGVDIGYFDIVPNDTAYGTDLLVQRAIVSEDWDYMASSESISSTGKATQVKTETVAMGISYVDQNPPGLGVAQQIALEVVDTTSDYFTVDAAGLFTCIVSDEYTVKIKLTIGREGTALVSQIYVRGVLNGVPVGDSTHTIIDTAKIEIPQFIDTNFVFAVGDTLAFEFVRDTDASDSGGLRAGIPDVVGWANSPSARITVVRNYLV